MSPISVSEKGLVFKGKLYACALGRSGIIAGGLKREGDGATPEGEFALRLVLYRPDRLSPPVTSLPCRAINPDDGWCDDPADVNYNRPVRLPYPASCEEMWRADGLYDLVVVLGHNDDPPAPGLGSAIFFHLATPDYSPTAGCVAVSLPDMLEILAGCGPEDGMMIVI